MGTNASVRIAFECPDLQESITCGKDLFLLLWRVQPAGFPMNAVGTKTVKGIPAFPFPVSLYRKRGEGVVECHRRQGSYLMESFH